MWLTTFQPMYPCQQSLQFSPWYPHPWCPVCVCQEASPKLPWHPLQGRDLKVTRSWNSKGEKRSWILSTMSYLININFWYTVISFSRWNILSKFALKLRINFSRSLHTYHCINIIFQQKQKWLLTSRKSSMFYKKQ